MQTGGFVFSHLIRWHEGMGLKSSMSVPGVEGQEMELVTNTPSSPSSQTKRQCCEKQAVVSLDGRFEEGNGIPPSVSLISRQQHLS